METKMKVEVPEIIEENAVFSTVQIEQSQFVRIELTPYVAPALVSQRMPISLQTTLRMPSPQAHLSSGETPAVTSGTAIF
jgi:hypothetical protein